MLRQHIISSNGVMTCVKLIEFLTMTGHDPYYIARNQLGCNFMINNTKRDSLL